MWSLGGPLHAGMLGGSIVLVFYGWHDIHRSPLSREVVFGVCVVVFISQGAGVVLCCHRCSLSVAIGGQGRVGNIHMLWR